MRLQSRYSDVVLNLLVAVAISLVVNFSYLLLLLVEQSSEAPPRSAGEQIAERRDAGTLFVHPDGYGYLIYANGDSVYTPSRRMRWLGLEAGDRIVADLMPPRNAGGHPVLERVRTLNDAEYDYSALYNRTSRWTELLLQLVFYLIMSFVMLSILTSSRRNYSMARYVRRCLWCIAAAVGLYCVAPVTEWHSGRIVMNFMGGRMFDYMLLLKCSFAVVVSLLYSRIYVLISQRQAVVVENERLKNENLTTRYNLLVGQINPHFFFNSLNSLAMLVRERQDDKALVYIDQLSYTFRYIIQNGQSTLMTLGEELKFAEAYSYLFRDPLCRQTLFRHRGRCALLRLAAAGALAPAADRQRRQTQHHHAQQSAPCLDPRGERHTGGLESSAAQARTRALDRYRTGEPAQPLAAHHGA